MKAYDFSDPESAEAHQNDHSRRMAEAMFAQATMGNQPAYSGRAALARALMGGLAGMQLGATEKKERELATKAQASRSAEMDQIAEVMQTAEGSPDRQRLVRLLIKSSNPTAAQAGLKLLTEKPKAPETYKLGPGEIVKDATGRVIADNPKATEPEKEPETVRAMKAQMTAAGIDPASPVGKQIFEAALKKSTTHQPAHNVTVNTGKKFGETLATEVAQQVAQSGEAARGAVDTLNTAKQIEGALASGKVMAGPGTSALMFVQQAIGAPSTEEGRVKTREVIQGLSQMTLAARKQLKGQGQVSDFEGKLLAKAASGDIDNLTVPEIQTLVKTATRLANGAITQHQSYLKKIQNDPELKGLAPFFDISTPQPGAPNPAVDELLKKYGGS